MTVNTPLRAERSAVASVQSFTRLALAASRGCLRWATTSPPRVAAFRIAPPRSVTHRNTPQRSTPSQHQPPHGGGSWWAVTTQPRSTPHGIAPLHAATRRFASQRSSLSDGGRPARRHPAGNRFAATRLFAWPRNARHRISRHRNARLGSFPRHLVMCLGMGPDPSSASLLSTAWRIAVLRRVPLCFATLKKDKLYENR